MLAQVETMFDGMSAMMKKLRKPSYEKNMTEFRRKNGHYFTEMTDYMDASEDKEAAAEHIAEVFTDEVETHFSVNGKMRGRTQADLNFFMIFYVFPAILLTEHEDAERIASAICEDWKSRFKDSNISYTTYDKMYDAFKNKVFGIF